MAVQAEGFVDIDINTLESVLMRETLNCKEMHLFKATLSWASAECSRRELEPTPHNMRQVLGTVLYLLRIPTMSLDEFANVAVPERIFSPQETIDIFLHYTARNKPQLNYPIKPRIGLLAQVLVYFLLLLLMTNAVYFSVFNYRGMNEVKYQKQVWEMAKKSTLLLEGDKKISSPR